MYSSEKSIYVKSTNTNLAISFQVKDHNSYESKLNSCKKTEEKNRLKRDLNPWLLEDTGAASLPLTYQAKTESWSPDKFVIYP